jgi:hypothetical protein
MQQLLVYWQMVSLMDKLLYNMLQGIIEYCRAASCDLTTVVSETMP